MTTRKNRNEASWTDTIDYLPTWQEIFDLTVMAEKGLTFESFMAEPWAWLRTHGQEQAVTSMAKGHRPLLPKQAEVAQRVLAEVLDEGEDLKHAVNHWGYH